MDSRFRAVCFDLYGTLTPDFAESDRLAMVAALADACGVPYEDFRGPWDASMHERLTGQITIRANALEICRALGVTPSSTQLEEAMRRRLASQEKYFQTPVSITETLKLVAHHGYAMAIVSAATEESSQLFARSPLAPFFSVTIFSDQVGVMKPDPKIFHLAADGLGVAPEQCLYVADGAFGELTGAEEAGMTSVLYRPQGGLPAGEVHRPDSEVDTWQGEVISAIPEVLRLIC